MVVRCIGVTVRFTPFTPAYALPSLRDLYNGRALYRGYISLRSIPPLPMVCRPFGTYAPRLARDVHKPQRGGRP